MHEKAIVIGVPGQNRTGLIEFVGVRDLHDSEPGIPRILRGSPKSIAIAATVSRNARQLFIG